MGSAGTKFDSGDPITAARTNQKTNKIDTGANILAETTYAGMDVYPTASSGALTVDIPARRDAANAAWVDYVMTTRTQTLTNKTLTAPTISNPTVTTGTFTTPVINDPTIRPASRTSFSLIPYFTDNTGFWNTRVAITTAVISNATGAINLSTGTTSSSDCGVRRSIPQNVTGNKAFELMIAITTGSAVTSTEIEVGVSSNTSSALATSANSHATIRLDTAVSAKWIAANANGTTETTTTLSGLADVASSTTYLIGIINKESSIEFYVNGVLAATHSTNLPTSTVMSITVFINNTTAADRQLNVKDGFISSDWA